MSIGSRTRTLWIGTVAVLLIAAACADDDDDQPEPTATSTATAPTAVPTTTATEAPTTPEVTATATVEAPGNQAGETLSANDASIAELTARFEAAGIAQAARWAREVDEYRPYSEDDTDYNNLRGELAKYNPGPGVVDAIIATLHLP